MMARGQGRRDTGAPAAANARGGTGIVDSNALGSTPSGGAWSATRRRVAVRAGVLAGAAGGRSCRWAGRGCCQERSLLFWSIRGGRDADA